jgi:hypothetical protein
MTGRRRLDERAVNGGERVRVAVQSVGVPVLGGHPEVPLDGLGDAVGQFVVEERPVAAQLGEQIVGKAVAPQVAGSDKSTGVVVGMRLLVSLTLT